MEGSNHHLAKRDKEFEILRKTKLIHQI